MRDKISESTQKIFRAVWERIAPFHEMIQSRPAVLSYSGGKDSSILLHFYFWLWIEKKIPAPCIYHLDHSIRFNLEQEKKSLNMQTVHFHFLKYSKKRIFLLCQEG
ncbi:PP-loop domain protein [Leptospira interrogans str. 2002000626]|uniref:PP-loop domain protein n=1 Tax=Leptospira interrogans str. 2002000626 TaxID=996803 RepID=A0A829D9B0_LEPIR|nr:PP-loop domain protein [Leptospira interrogans str. 2002000626]